MLCNQSKMLMELHRRYDRKAALEAVVIVEINVVCNHLHELCSVVEFVTIVAFSFQDAPEAFHWAVIKAVRHTGHTLLHACRPQFLVEGSACILVAPVAVEQRVSLWIGGYGGFEGIKDEFVVVVVANGEGNNSPVAKIQNGAEIELVHHWPHIVFEFGHIGQPFQVGRVGMEAAAQVVLCHILRRCRAPGTAMPPELDGGLDMERTADAQDTLVVDSDAMMPVQFIPHPAVSHIRVNLMNFLHLLRDTLVFLFTQALRMIKPSVIR